MSNKILPTADNILLHAVNAHHKNKNCARNVLCKEEREGYVDLVISYMKWELMGIIGFSRYFYSSCIPIQCPFYYIHHVHCTVYTIHPS